MDGLSSAQSAMDRGGDDSVDDQNAAEAEAAQHLNNDSLHAEVSGEEGEQVQAGAEGAEAEDDLEHERQEERQHRDGDAEGAGSVDGER